MSLLQDIYPGAVEKAVRNVVTRDGLLPGTFPCPECRRSTVGFHVDTSKLKESPYRPVLSGFPERYLGGRRCRVCQFWSHLGRLLNVTPHDNPPERTIADELAELRREMAALKAGKAVRAPEPGPAPLVDVGTVYATRSARGMVDVDPLVRRHESGDHGIYGFHPVEITAEDRHWGPLAAIGPQNSIALIDGVGSVRSEYEHVSGKGRTMIWTEIEAGPRTLVYSDRDDIDMDA